LTNRPIHAAVASVTVLACGTIAWVTPRALHPKPSTVTVLEHVYPNTPMVPVQRPNNAHNRCIARVQHEGKAVELCSHIKV
jgi:hypothetical protein